MATIDDKVVAMSFESSKFESGINKAINALEKLKASLKMDNAGKGFAEIDKAAKKVDLGFIGRALDSIKSKLAAFRLVAIGVMSNLANSAVRAGGRFVKAFTLDPIIAGFHEYTTNLNAVQTILANTQASGAKLKDVNAALKTLNDYSDKTIYNFSQMAKNIGTFTAAGVDLDTSTAAIKGIANLAALSGSNADQASTAMYQLSQAISAGRVSLQDWNSVVNAGMGGTVFQRALAQTAEAMGTLKDGTVKLTGPMKNVSIAGESFRQSLQAGPGKKSWLTSKVLTTTLKQFTGDLSDAELAAMGFNDAQIAAIQQTAKTAQKAATEVKTISQVLDVAKETAGSGWAQTFQIIFGNFSEAKSTFTDLSNTINGFINQNADARNKVLADWKALGGRTVLINAIKIAFQNLGAILKPIKQAFRDIFPAATGKTLFDLTKQFEAFAKTLKPTPQTVENLRRTFRGLFAALDIAKQLIGGVFTVFGQLFGVVGEGSSSFLDFTGSIGDFLVSVDQALKKGDRLHNFFVTLGSVLAAPLRILGALKDAIANLFGGFSSGGFSQQMSGMTQSMTPFQKALQGIADAWVKFLDGFGNTGKVLQPAIDAIVKLMQGLGPAISSALSTMNFEAILQVIRTGLFAGLVLMFKQFLGKGSGIDQITKGFGGGILANISGSFRALEGSMVALQQNIKAKTLKEIAIAIGILAASVVVLSFVDPKRLNSALAAMTVGFGQLLGAMFILTNVTKTVGFIKLPVIAGSLILLAGAIDVLAIAVIALSKLSWGELVKGLGAVGFLLGAIVVAAIPLSASSSGLIRAGIGMTAIAVALRILANAVAAFGAMSLGTMGKGLAGVAIGLVLIAAAMTAMPKNMVLTGVGLVAVAVGLRIIANVVAKFGEMNWSVIGKGMAGIAASLIIIAAAMHLMPSNMVLTAAGLLLVSVALQGIVKAVSKMGGMSVAALAKGLVGLAISLALLAAALIVMSGSLTGAAALTVAAAGIALLAPALVALGKQSWTQILKGLVTLAAALVILGAAGILLTPTIPSLLGLGAALVLIGAGLALAGAGIFLIATGLSALVVAAPTGVGVLLAAFTELQAGIIKNAKLLVLGLLEIVRAFANTAPQFVDALVKIIDSLLNAIIKSSPKIAEAFTALLTAAVKVLHDNQPRIIQAGFDLLLALLQGIKNNIGKIVTSVVDIIRRFLSSIANNLSKIIDAGSKVILALIKGIVSGYSKVLSTAISIVTKFISAIASLYGKIASAGLTILAKFLGGIASNLGKVISAGTNVIVQFITGVGNAGPRIITAATNAIIKFINALQKNANKLAAAGGKAIIAFLNGIAATIDQQAPQMRQAGFNVGVALVDGMTLGLASKTAGFLKKAGDFVNAAKKKLEFWHSSPFDYGKFLGQNVILGLTNGIETAAPGAYAAAEEISKGTIKMFNDVFQTASPSKVMQQIGQFVGQGFAKGLRGSRADIKDAFTELNNDLSKAILDARQTIASERAKIAAERKQKKPDKSVIREANQEIANQEALLRRLNATRKESTNGLAKERAELLKNKSEWAKLKEKLDGATQALKDAKQARDDAISGFKDQYSELPEIAKEVQDAEGNIKPLSGAEQLAAYEAALVHQTNAVAAYQSTLEQLRKLGLDDATYQKLLREGTADQQFADALLAGGKTAVTSLNTLDSDLIKNATKLATNAGNNLYQAGVDAAQGLVDGLTSKVHDIEKAMEKIAIAMIKAIKKKLKIKSPSEIFAGLGQESMAGMAQGVSESTKMVTDAVDQVAQDALTQMQDSMGNISDLITEELDQNPVITPILDLTQIRSRTGELAALTATSSYGQASAISSEQAARAAEVEQVAAAGGTSVKFEQNNYSPEALTEVEIYRQTKNQLSQLKSALALT